MSERSTPAPPVATARLAGLLYLLIIVCGLFSEIVVRGRLVVPDDPAATAAGILASEGLFRLAFLSDSIVFLCDVALAILLYVLLRPVNRTVAMVAAAFRLTQTAVLALNLLNQHTALLVLTGAGFADVGTAPRQALAYLMLDRHAHGYDLGLLFFGVHCLLLGWLVARSGYLPRVLGYLLGGASLAYLAGGYVRFLAPAHSGTVAPIYLLAIVSEVALCGWLLVRGVRVEAWGRVASDRRRTS